jgi:MFS superfamily sulfate permease-like transporter
MSKPVLSGFTNAAALLIISSQLRFIFGVDTDPIDTIIDSVTQFRNHIGSANGILPHSAQFALFRLSNDFTSCVSGFFPSFVDPIS